MTSCTISDVYVVHTSIIPFTAWSSIKLCSERYVYTCTYIGWHNQTPKIMFPNINYQIARSYDLLCFGQQVAQVRSNNFSSTMGLGIFMVMKFSQLLHLGLDCKNKIFINVSHGYMHSWWALRWKVWLPTWSRLSEGTTRPTGKPVCCAFYSSNKECL